MRYYVLLDGVADGAPRPFIVAETVGERGDDGSERAESLAAVLAGPHARIVTEVELPRIAGGEMALAEWRDVDDSRYGDTTAELENGREGEGPSGSTKGLASVTQLKPRRRRHPAGSV